MPLTKKTQVIRATNGGKAVPWRRTLIWIKRGSQPCEDLGESISGGGGQLLLVSPHRTFLGKKIWGDFQEEDGFHIFKTKIEH